MLEKKLNFHNLENADVSTPLRITSYRKSYNWNSPFNHFLGLQKCPLSEKKNTIYEE